MAKQDTFKVSSKKHEGFTITTDRKPENIDEFLSLNLVSKEDDVVDLAWQNWVIKAQARGRGQLEKGQEAVQKAIDEYTYGARGAGTSTRTVKPKVSKDQAKDLRFTKVQIEALRAAGVAFEGMEEEETETPAEQPVAAGATA